MYAMIRKWKLLLVGVSCVMGTAMAQNNPILLFPKGAPGETTKLIEKADSDGGKTGGETVLRITNVSEPTITVYPAPDEVATGAAVVVCPGGGYNILAYDLEGDEVCEWLNNLGGSFARRATCDRICPDPCGRNEPGPSADRSNGILCRRTSFGDGKQQFR